MPDLVFKLSEDKKEYAVSFCDRNATEVKIPSRYKGKPVTKIGSRAFWDCTYLTDITIPNSITAIGDFAFSGLNGGCCSLTSINIPDSVTSIGQAAFWGCASLTSATIAYGITNIGDYAFCLCTSLETVYWNATVCTKAGSKKHPIFQNCTSLKTVIIGDNVTTMPDYVFCNCKSLTSVTMSDSVVHIQSGSFAGSVSMMGINVDQGNPNFESVDGNLYTKGGEMLIQYALGKQDTSFAVPDSVKYIGDMAFRDCKSLLNIIIYPGAEKIGAFAFSHCNSLRSLTIPDTVTTIGSFAFFRCGSLTGIRIGKAVIDIGDNVFKDCDSLKEIYYNGTKAQWKAIKKGSNWGPGSYKISCLDGIIDQ